MPGVTHAPLFAFFSAASFANKQNSTAGIWRLGADCSCVEPKLSPCVHWEIKKIKTYDMIFFSGSK
jgi:hypothetical protein